MLVGTVSIEKSEKLSAMLDRRGLKRGTTTGGGVDKHVVLNAKYHAQEAEFVAQAGRKGAVTIATNMAGRGTDILLGGNAEFMARQQCLAEEIAERLPEGRRAVRRGRAVRLLLPPRRVLSRAEGGLRAHLRALQERRPTRSTTRSSALGGLHIVGTERHEARRIDNQLRGRAGRQGDPGSSRFYLSLEDDLMRIFGSRSDLRPDAEARHGRGRADRARHGDPARSSARRSRSRRRTSPSASTCSNTTM